jgi:hypothetical protein
MGPVTQPRHALSRRHPSRRVRRKRILFGLVAVVICGVLLGTCVTGGGGVRKSSAPRRHSETAAAGAIPAAESGLLPWSLPAPISREVVLPSAGAQVLILGGLNGSNSASGVFSLDTGSGALAQVGSLPSGVHDATGAVIAGEDVILGGGSANSVASVQSFPQIPPTPSRGPGLQGSSSGTLPQPRSDAASVTIGRTTYVIGGYNGSSADPDVLSTSDGRTFRVFARLDVPVRYAAVAASAGRIYVFGGEGTSGARAGAPVDDIQMVNTSTGAVSIVGHTPEPIEGAEAVDLSGHIYLAGGDSTTVQTATPGMGTTQLAPAGAGANPGAGASGAITDAFVQSAPGPTSTTEASGRTPSNTVSTRSVSLSTTSTIWAFDTTSDKLAVAGRLQAPVSHAGVAVVGNRAWIVGGETNGTQQSTVEMLQPNSAYGTAGAPGAGSPYFGAKLLVADRGNNRLLLMDAAMNILWTYPSPKSSSDPLGFYFPDDAFFVDRGTAIISNQEENETIVEIAYPSGKIIWSYGHPKTPGTAPGYLHEPDDAYLLKNGEITVADAQNCRVLVLSQSGTVLDQIGTTGVCVHNPPKSVGSPNGDTPLADGNLLVSEINGSWVSEYTTSGDLVWTVHLPIGYPSDPQQLGPDRYLIADYAKPGEILEFSKEGQIFYKYSAASGPGMLNHPSLVEQLPSGALMANDDYRDRMVAFDPQTGALVWQYGINDQAGTAPGMLNTPDGFDLLLPDGSTPTHSATG